MRAVIYTKNKMVGMRVLHPFAARARSAALVDATLTLLTHSAKNDYQSFS